MATEFYVANISMFSLYVDIDTLVALNLFLACTLSVKRQLLQFRELCVTLFGFTYCAQLRPLVVKNRIKTCIAILSFITSTVTVSNGNKVVASGGCFCATADPARTSYVPGFTGRPQSDYGTIRRYLICRACLLVQRASWGPLTVGAGGRGCQFRRDALGAPLPPRARRTGAEPAA